MFASSYMGVQVWLITSRQMLPDLFTLLEVHVRVVDLVHEADGGRLVRVAIGQVNAQFPVSLFVERALGPLELNRKLSI